MLYWKYNACSGAPPRLDERRPLNGWCRLERHVRRVV